jgi:hypothetical protein
MVLDGRVDGDQANAGDRRAFIHEGAAHDLAVHLGDHRVEARVAEQHRQQPGRHVGRVEVRREVVLAGDRAEGLVADAPTGLGVLGRPRPQLEVHDALLWADGSSASLTRGRRQGKPEFTSLP